MENPITAAKINGLDYYRVPMPSGMAAFVKFSEEADWLHAASSSHEVLIKALKQAEETLDDFNRNVQDYAMRVKWTLDYVREALSKAGAK